MDKYSEFLNQIKDAHKDWGVGEGWYESDQPIEEKRKPKPKKKKKKKDYHEYSATTPGKDVSSNLSFQTLEYVDGQSLDTRSDDRFDFSDEYRSKPHGKGAKISRSKDKLNKKATFDDVSSDRESEVKVPSTEYSLDYSTSISLEKVEQKQVEETPFTMVIDERESEPPDAQKLIEQQKPEPKPSFCKPDPGDAYNFELKKPKSPCEPADDTGVPCWESEVSTTEASTPSCKSECTSGGHSAVVQEQEPCCQCGAEVKIEKPTCQCPPKASIEDEPQEPTDFKRYAILKEIPCDEKAQRGVVKKVLEIMAEDGFVLARLPDAYKLPHFKLWMQMRCGKVWMRKDREKFQLLSITLWGHTQICYKSVATPKLGISRKKAKTVTWKHAEVMKNMVAAKTNEFYRALRRERINSAREFYPTTFSYEFPTPTFRDCYFAYLPAKEEDLVFPTIEEKKFLKRYQCYC
ncbi:unnamed protein product [Callosobruchus maculatus]|uniref:DUF4771 domain-containing protein n=1 Tax=Callosobruchus maculatus TaxID=64391 RepID=A0A653C8V4_CALMS|nr:unnamed protein product [Callosobruchus maculatus]